MLHTNSEGETSVLTVKLIQRHRAWYLGRRLFGIISNLNSLNYGIKSNAEIFTKEELMSIHTSLSILESVYEKRKINSEEFGIFTKNRKKEILSIKKQKQ